MYINVYIFESQTNKIMARLSPYTIAKNCTDLDDIKEGLKELREYFDECNYLGKKPTDMSYKRLIKLYEKQDKLKKLR
jgi:hypothetical protein